MITTKLQQVHFRLSTTLPSRTHIRTELPENKTWTTNIREGSFPSQVLEEIKKHGEMTNEQLRFIGERKNIIVALYSLRRKGLIVGVGEAPYSKHRIADARP